MGKNPKNHFQENLILNHHYIFQKIWLHDNNIFLYVHISSMRLIKYADK